MTAENQVSQQSQFERDKEIYNQDSEFYRHQDRLRWSRFQTIITIEGAWLLALFSGKLSLDQTAILCFGFLGFLIISVLCLLSLKDEIDANEHLNRLGEIEDEWGRVFGQSRERPSHITTGDGVVAGIRHILPSGTTLQVTAIAALTIFNLLILIKKVHFLPTAIMVLLLVLFWCFMHHRKGSSIPNSSPTSNPHS